MSLLQDVIGWVGGELEIVGTDENLRITVPRPVGAPVTVVVFPSRGERGEHLALVTSVVAVDAVAERAVAEQLMKSGTIFESGGSYMMRFQIPVTVVDKRVLMLALRRLAGAAAEIHARVAFRRAPISVPYFEAYAD